MFVIPLMSDEENKSTEEELIAVRREKLNRLRELGVNPYGERFLIDKEIDELSESFHLMSLKIHSMSLNHSIISNEYYFFFFECQ